ncbi:hypothetical protein [Rubrobacter indicoceani]|uniref:hypothetical protein n=1 Tax=Rubrobacter indicoceani TaxID=2051957 RepID=UPI0013C480BD|nr:hypothetical protein [Rubrobacter indicoceani]
MDSLPKDSEREQSAAQAWCSGNLERLIAECSPEIQKTVLALAVRHQLPWDLLALQEAAGSGVVEAAKSYNRTSGYSFQQQAFKFIERSVDNEARRLMSGGDGKEAFVSDERIRTALESLSVPMWEELIRDFTHQNTMIFRPYLNANKESLLQWLGESKFYRIFNELVSRGLIQFFSQPNLKTTRPTDAYWTAHIIYNARLSNIRGEPRPSVKRSWGEVMSKEAIAASLGTTPYKVGQIIKRMQEVPFSEFENEDINDYCFWATDPKAYKRHKALLARNTYAKRLPDPFFN